MNRTFDVVFPVVLPILLTGLTAALAWVAAHLGAYLRAKAISSRAFAAVAVLEDTVIGIVQDIANVEKAEVLRVNGNVLTPLEGAKLKALALVRLKSDLGTQGLETLKRMIVSVLGSGSVESFLSGKIEQAVTTIGAPVTQKIVPHP